MASNISWASWLWSKVTGVPPRIASFFHKKPEFSEQELEEAKKNINDHCEYNPYAQGIIFDIAILMTDLSHHPGGGQTDEFNIMNTFHQKLNFTVCPLENPTPSRLACLLKAAAEFKKYPPCYKFIAFYYSGHGGIDDFGRKFILPKEEKDDNSHAHHHVLYIEEDILYHFQFRSNNKDRKCLFFFDCCLDYQKGFPVCGTAPFSSGLNIPCPPKSLVAYATSFNHLSQGNDYDGGLWTKFLCQYLCNKSPLSKILEDTHHAVEKQSNKHDGSTYQSPIHICDPDVGEVCLKAESTDETMVSRNYPIEKIGIIQKTEKEIRALVDKINPKIPGKITKISYKNKDRDLDLEIKMETGQTYVALFSIPDNDFLCVN